MNNPISIYIHIPFCEAKCGYCDFYSVPRGAWDFDVQEQYVEALCREIDVSRGTSPWVPQNGRARGPAPTTNIRSIYFGGGTPSLLRIDLLENILNKLGDFFSWDASTEITMEANPKTISFDGLKERRSLGINRISIGVQSFQDPFLKTLGRIHSSQEAMQTVQEALEAGFENVNLDLIFGLPGQDLTDWQRDLESALELKPMHLSCYALTIEAGTPFASRYPPSPLMGEGRGGGDHGHPPLTPPVQGGESLPDDKTVLDQFFYTRERLAKAGLPAYEISNFARPGYECVHNRHYWEYGEYLGFGVAAATFIRTYCRGTSPWVPSQLHQSVGRARGPAPTNNLFAIRSTNIRDIQQYITGDFEPEIDSISTRTAMGEFVMLALRTREGVSEEKFQKTFGAGFTDVFGNVLSHVGAPLRGCPKTGGHGDPPLQDDNSHWKLTERGLAIADTVITEFISPQSA